MEEKQLKEKIKLAEAAVSELRDPTLKEKAFEVVLSNLLNESASPKVFQPVLTKRPKTVRTSLNGKVGRLTEQRKSNLKFDESQLQELRKFYDDFKPAGREMCIFILANFLTLKINQEKFHEGDIEYCYQKLLNLKPNTRPPAMRFSHIKQTLSWLTAPSRRKQWLELDIDMMYKISSDGILKFQDLEKLLSRALKKGEEKT